MKILLDLQGCQSASRFRGIGRYSLAFAKALMRNRGSHTIKLLLNGLYADGIDELRQQFEGLVSAEDILIFDADGPVAEFDTANIGRARLAELARERLITSINPDVVLLTSLFEGFIDDAITSVGRIGNGPFTIVTLYDLIPYLNPDPHWPAHYKNYYELKIESLKRADLLLSISEYARQECVGAIPILSDRLVNMSSACDSMFCLDEVVPERLAELLKKFDITHPFIMSAGNLEPRKNFTLLIRAFAGMPEELKKGRQIVLVGGAEVDRIDEIKLIASESGIADGQLKVLGHVDDDDLRDLYRICELFVFPSLHEGFGLPPLEAMSCGAVVIGSNATSVPEVIGREDALFDPSSMPQLRDLMIKALTDQDFRRLLKTHGLNQAKKFSWDKTAQLAISAIEQRLGKRAGLNEPSPIPLVDGVKPCLAMVSPLPPEQTGIADYLADLLPELGKVYDITVISDQTAVSLGPDGEVFRVASVAWFEGNVALFERIVYQVGNSPFHAHMLDLLARYPGIVVLHDFYISNLKLWKEVTGYRAKAFQHALLHSHGYVALSELERNGDQAAKFRWPCSFPAVNGALGLIVHSTYCRDLVSHYYGDVFDEKVSVVRQHRVPVSLVERSSARRRLGIADDAFLVCAFGFMDPTKLNLSLLEAWSISSLATDSHSQLVFVGGKAEPDYARQIETMIAGIDGGARIAITGFAPHELFADYLAAADLAVQLRTLSRGETSRTVLDCLAYGVPLVINAHGPMREYPDDVLIKLPDEFDVSELVDVLERLRHEEQLRQNLATKGVDYIRKAHAPALTVQGYVNVIEGVVNSAECQRVKRAITDFWQILQTNTREERSAIAQKVADLLITPRRPVIYLDISATAHSDLKTGIERVARALVREMLLVPPHGYLVVPVYLAQENGFWRVRKANQYLAQQPGFSLVPPEDELVIPVQGDILMGLDLFADGVCAAERQGLYTYWRAAGAKLGFMVYDLLPITHPQFFPPWAQAGHEEWMKSISSVADLLVCISEHVKSEVERWMAGNEMADTKRPRIVVSHLGADVQASFPTSGLPSDADHMLEILRSRPTFLMVGTIEPRKGYLHVIAAFEALWCRGVEANLVIVGHEGWKSLPDQDRRTIPEIVRRIQNSPYFGIHFFWLEGISDEYLEKIYGVSSCLIAASEDEGFGLPLIEASHHGVPVLARDIPVFREVCGDAVRYFPVNGIEGLVEALQQWLEQTPIEFGCEKSSISWLSWRESAANLCRHICVSNERSYEINL